MSDRWQGQGLLEPISADQPCGESLEDTPVLVGLDGYRLFGQSRSPEAPPDKDEKNPRKPPEWGAVQNSALEALTKSKDLRVLAYLGTALLRTDGFPAFVETLTIAAAWLENYWSQLYPLIDEDAMLRRNALNCFADPMVIVDRVRRMPMVSSRQHGTFSLRDIEIASGQMPPGASEARPDESRITAAFTEMPLDELQRLQQSVSAALAALKGINATMTEQASTEALPEFEPLTAQLVKMDRVVRAQLATRVEAVGADGELEPGSAPAGATGAVGAIRSRQDAIRALDAVAEFFRHNEPSSPVPLFLDRAKRLVSKNFLEVLADVAPDALVQARTAGGLPSE